MPVTRVEQWARAFFGAVLHLYPASYRDELLSVGSRDTLPRSVIRESKKPACANPIWSPTTDDELMKQTIEIAERRNIVGVLSGPAARVAAWVKAKPRRFIRGLQFQLSDKETPSPAALRAMPPKENCRCSVR